MKKAVSKKPVAKKAPVKAKAGLSFADLDQSTVYQVTKGTKGIRKGSDVRRFGDRLLSGKDIQKHNTGDFSNMTFIPSKSFGLTKVAKLKAEIVAVKKAYGIKGRV